MNVNSEWFEIDLYQELFWSCECICFKDIQNSRKSNGAFQAWTDVCHQIVGGQEVQTM